MKSSLAMVTVMTTQKVLDEDQDQHLLVPTNYGNSLSGMGGTKWPAQFTLTVFITVISSTAAESDLQPNEVMS